MDKTEKRWEGKQRHQEQKWLGHSYPAGEVQGWEWNPRVLQAHGRFSRYIWGAQVFDQPASNVFPTSSMQVQVALTICSVCRSPNSPPALWVRPNKSWMEKTVWKASYMLEVCHGFQPCSIEQAATLAGDQKMGDLKCALYTPWAGELRNEWTSWVSVQWPLH